jgi:hypothetical protein
MHEYPQNPTLDSVSERRVNTLAGFGFTRRQREFLATVMVHAGCFLERQYCAFAGTVRGQNSREFGARLVARGFAGAIEPGPVRRAERDIPSAPVLGQRRATELRSAAANYGRDGARAHPRPGPRSVRRVRSCGGRTSAISGGGAPPGAPPQRLRTSFIMNPIKRTDTGRLQRPLIGAVIVVCAIRARVDAS